MHDQLSMLLLQTPCQTFLNEIKLTIENFEQKTKLTNDDNQAIAMIRATLLNTSVMSGVTVRLALKIILKMHYTYFGWRYWSDLPKKLNALRLKPEFSETALRNGDLLQTYNPSNEKEKKLNQELTLSKEKNEYLESKLQQTSCELMSAWEDKSALEAKLCQLEKEKQLLMQQQKQNINEINYWKQAFQTINNKSHAHPMTAAKTKTIYTKKGTLNGIEQKLEPHTTLSSPFNPNFFPLVTSTLEQELLEMNNPFIESEFSLCQVADSKLKTGTNQSS